MPHDFPKKRHRYHLLISIWQIRGFSSCRQVSSDHVPQDSGICLCWVWSNDCSFFSETVSVRVCHQEVSSECCQSIRSTMLLPRHRCIVVCPEGESCSCTWRPSTPSPWSDSPPAMPWAATGLNILTVSWFPWLWAIFLISVYLPMQHIYTIDWKRFSLLIGTTRIFTMTRKILTNSSCWKSAISIYVLYRAFQAHFQVSVETKLK